MAEGRKTSSEHDRQRNKSRKGDKRDNHELKYVDEAGRVESLPECAVCLQTCVHPARLPCSHIFCFLCLKGLATQSRRCAMCRQEIPADYLDHPQLLEAPTVAEKDAFEDGYQWFYEGRSGWWQYDERTSRELELAYKNGLKTCELLIVGQLYIADFDAMLQLRRNDLSRRRRMKRDLASIPKKGIAGLRIEGSSPVNSDVVEEVSAPSTSQQDRAVSVSSVVHSSSSVAESALFESQDWHGQTEVQGNVGLERNPNNNSFEDDVNVEVNETERRPTELENDSDDLSVQMSRLHNLRLH